MVGDGDFAKAASRRPLHASFGEWIRLDDGKRVLELGCGPGKYVAMLAKLGFEVIGVDPLSFGSWSDIRDRCEVQMLANVYAERLPFADDTFDHVLCAGALLYFSDAVRAMSEIRRTLRPGGHLVLRTVSRGNLYTRFTGKKLDPASHNLYSMAQLQELVHTAGLTVERSFAYGFWPPFAPDWWFYLQTVWLPEAVQIAAGRILPSSMRINNVVFASKPVSASPVAS